MTRNQRAAANKQSLENSMRQNLAIPQFDPMGQLAQLDDDNARRRAKMAAMAKDSGDEASLGGFLLTGNPYSESSAKLSNEIGGMFGGGVKPPEQTNPLLSPPPPMGPQGGPAGGDANIAQMNALPQPPSANSGGGMGDLASTKDPSASKTVMKMMTGGMGGK